MDNAIKHLEKLRKQIDSRLGKGKADEILQGMDALMGDESLEEIGKWAEKITEKLESSIRNADLIPIRKLYRYVAITDE